MIKGSRRHKPVRSIAVSAADFRIERLGDDHGARERERLQDR
jgi:hypothetical protein